MLKFIPTGNDFATPIHDIHTKLKFMLAQHVCLTNHCSPRVQLSIHATAAWTGPHSLGHNVFQVPLTQICKTFICLSSPFSHKRSVPASQVHQS